MTSESSLMKCKLPLAILLIILINIGCNYNPYPQGKILYDRFCSGCHGLEGEGFRNLYPPLAQSDYFQKDPYLTACLIAHGIEDSIIVNGKYYQQPMMAVENLNAVEICNIINYISFSWNPAIVTPLHQDSVKARLENCKDWPTLR